MDARSAHCAHPEVRRDQFADSTGSLSVVSTASSASGIFRPIKHPGLVELPELLDVPKLAELPARFSREPGLELGVGAAQLDEAESAAARRRAS